ncbi:MAG TPA: DinB family protein [Flavitalea sp.]|nr:DinB family protein [Flavitalea sp.]
MRKLPDCALIRESDTASSTSFLVSFPTPIFVEYNITYMFNPGALLQTVDSWIQFLYEYNEEQLTIQVDEGSWSIGQLYNHLISDSYFYIMQANHARLEENKTRQATAEATEMFKNNAFPATRIKGHPSNASIPQPGNKDELKQGLIQLQDEICELILKVNEQVAHGKSEHPGLGYLSTGEWIQLMDMHFRHHLDQKRRIDEFLQSKKGMPVAPFKSRT